MSKDHDKVAEDFAKWYKTEHRHKGVDIRPPKSDLVIEIVGSVGDVNASIKQVKHHPKMKKYLVPTDREIMNEIKKETEGTEIGIKNRRNKIIKRARRPKK